MGDQNSSGMISSDIPTCTKRWPVFFYFNHLHYSDLVETENDVLLVNMEYPQPPTIELWLGLKPQ
jgi:hypothetical protein